MSDSSQSAHAIDEMTRALLGTWYLREAFAVDPNGQRLYDVYGARPSGVIHYGDDRRMIALITHEGRPRLNGDRQAAPERERAAAYKSSIAYAGGFELDGEWVKHNIDISTYPNWVGVTLLRQVRIENGSIILLTAPQLQDGIKTVIKLVWQRKPVDSITP
jgi:hypothetical protein